MRKLLSIVGLALGMLLSGAATASAASWHVVKSPNFNFPDDTSQLSDVSASSATNVWAVGKHGNINGFQPVVIRWNGQTWKRIPPPPSFTEITNVYAFSPTSVWVSGPWKTDTDFGVGLAHWNGSTWAIHHVNDHGNLADIDAISPTDIWAAASSNTQLSCPSERWNGHNWFSVTISSCPAPGVLVSNSADVAAISDDDVWVLEQGGNNGFDLATAEHWNGQSWTSTPLPSWGNYSWAYGISATSAGNVWVAGTAQADNPPSTNFGWAARWDATSGTWIPYRQPEFGLWHGFRDVAAASPSSVWAVGVRLNEEFRTRTYTAHWDGAGWTDLGGPNPGKILDELNAVTVVPGTTDNVWAVGEMRLHAKTTANRTLVIHWS
jgi:hypothetical protein